MTQERDETLSATVGIYFVFLRRTASTTARGCRVDGKSF